MHQEVLLIICKQMIKVLAIGTKDDKRVVKAFYYDADYKLLKIVVKTRKEFYAK